MIGYVLLFPTSKKLPDGWLWMDGQVVEIKEYQQLFDAQYIFAPKSGFEKTDNKHFKIPFWNKNEIHRKMKFAIRAKNSE